MADIELIGVPFDGYGRPGNQARAAEVLHNAGLADAFDHHHVTTHDLVLPEPDRGRGASTGLINETALLAMTDALNIRVGEAVLAGRFPVVYGGDCSSLFGVVTGLRDHVGDVGLVFVDGHEDTMPLDVSEDGEAANTEIGLLLGLTGRLLAGGLGDRLPALRPEQLIVLGPRDDAWRRRFNVGTLADSGVWLAPLAEVADDPAGAGRAAMAELAAHVDRWWLHIDLDVLDPLEFPAQGLPDVADEPGGLTWDQLTDLVVSLFGSRAHCVGASLAIYDPDQDHDRTDAANIVQFVRNALARTTLSP
ncbi:MULTISPECIES: arginase family protein [Mycobacteriaceae]|jgi:arginase|uniref:arginase family protein n=1 Tax=Mycobacteriaceae TaxID=1762 RepID=UPI0029390527|nr:arginase family protein [Mycobacterium sp. 29Ha]MDV3131066.1 arginase family protein [Mycobacterium sp. 29Ha]